MSQVLRGAGYPDQALWVAHQASQPEWMLEIMIDDMGDYSQAIGFLVEVSPLVFSAYTLHCIKTVWSLTNSLPLRASLGIV